MRSKQKKGYIICMIKHVYFCTITQSIVAQKCKWEMKTILRLISNFNLIFKEEK